MKPNPAKSSGGKPPEVEIVVSVSRVRVGLQSCDASVDPGDGSRPRLLEFGVATIRGVRHVYNNTGAIAPRSRERERHEKEKGARRRLFSEAVTP